ncbi:hypothetical protein IW262DRAFT_1299695 [Armillaria fumosa]|nr:hypothetical protein IW262DRAFT_1299695 [Armillaria fumosa]
MGCKKLLPSAFRADLGAERTCTDLFKLKSISYLHSTTQVLLHSAFLYPDAFAFLLYDFPFKDKLRQESKVATVGERDGSMLVVTVFDEEIPSITPQRQDTRTLRIPVPKPTLDAKPSVATAPGKNAEDTWVQFRKLHQESVKKGKYEKRSIELEVFQDLFNNPIADISKFGRI